MTSIRIATRDIGHGHPVFLIAELSANHGADRGIALRTIEAAAKAGADAIKLQTYTPETLTLRSDAPPFVVQTKNEWAGRTLHDLYAEAMTPWEWHAELKEAAESLGLIFFSTPFDPTAVEFLESLGAVAHKIASFELTDLPLVEHVARRGRPMILSTGMASLGEIEEAVAACRGAGNDQLALLRCVSAYPAEPSAMALSSLVALASFGTVVGLSDHTRDATAAIAAVALGAKIIEKHFILDRSIGGPDAFFSLAPDEFAFLVRSVRDAESAIGSPRFGPSEGEQSSLRFRRSLFVSRPVAQGELLTTDNVRSVRPADGIAAKYLPNVLGRVATSALGTATPLAWHHVQEPPAARVTLRRATAADAPHLLELRNEAVTRSMSKTTHVVSAAEHSAWLNAVLVDSTRALFVAESESRAIGQARLDGLGGAAAEISLALSPGARGQGLGVDVLRAAERAAKECGVHMLEAVIRKTNDRSVSAFKRAGYYGFVERRRDGEAFLHCERKVLR